MHLHSIPVDILLLSMEKILEGKEQDAEVIRVVFSHALLAVSSQRGNREFDTNDLA